MQIDPLAETLTRAFADDPLMRYVLPDQPGRLGRLGWLMNANLRYGRLFGTIDATQDAGAGAIWIGPDQQGFSWRRLLRAGLLGAPFRLGWPSVRRMLRVLDSIDGAHSRAMPERHWYLMVLGVEPASQGRGLGGRLLEEGLLRVDAAGSPCYLETFQELTLRFYARHGFRVIAEGEVPGGPRFWSLARPVAA